MFYAYIPRWTSTQRIRNIPGEPFCNSYYGRFEPRRWLVHIRYEWIKGEENWPPSHYLSKGVGVSLAWVDLKWKNDLFNTKYFKLVKNCNNELLEMNKKKEIIEKLSNIKYVQFIRLPMLWLISSWDLFLTWRRKEALKKLLAGPFCITRIIYIFIIKWSS